MKSKYYGFSEYKLWNKLCVVYLLRKLRQESYSLRILKLKWKKENGRKNIFRENQTTNKVRPMFLDLKVLTER